MTRYSKGTIEQSGKKVRQKSGLQRAILDKGWGEFGQQLAYKMEWKGGTLLATPPYPISQMCPDKGIGGTGMERTPPLQQQAASNPTKSRISNNLRVSSEFVVIYNTKKRMLAFAAKPLL